MPARISLKTAIWLLAALVVAVPSQEALALIFGGTGNAPLRDPGWPKGAAVIFNTQSRVAYWEGPPLGGGQWHAECRGDTKALSAVLADFAKLEVKSKRIVLHDGVGNSFWLNINNDPAKRAAAKIDWTFMVWVTASWEGRRKLPAAVKADAAEGEGDPPAQLDVYTGGNVNWDDVKVPKDLKIVDQRLVAHGFTLADGVVLEGKVTELATKKPVAAKIMLQRVEPQPKGGYSYPTVAETLTDAQGHWVFKKAPEGWHRVVIEADGFIARVAGHGKFDQPRWQSYDAGLARPGPVTGRVLDDAGQPLADVEVRIGNIMTDGGGYESPFGYSFKTGKDGRFRAEQVPIGKASIWVHKPGYVRPGLGPTITTPANDVELTMTKSARVEVTVDFAGKDRPEGYIVQIAPEGGEKIGSWGGSGNINDKSQITYEHVPPGRYVLTGRPNPGSANQQTEPVTVELKGGETTKATLKAK